MMPGASIPLAPLVVPPDHLYFCLMFCEQFLLSGACVYMPVCLLVLMNIAVELLWATLV